MIDAERANKLLSGRELLFVVFAVLPIFFFLGGPIWDHAFHIDASVWWSYAPIPFLVALLLVKRRAWSFSGFLVSLTIALAVKYMVTTTIAFALWTIGEPPPLARWIYAAEPSAPRTKHAGEEAKPIEIVLDEQHRTPVDAVVERDQPIVFRTHDRVLHTVLGTAGDRTIAFNQPLVPGAEPAVLRIARPGKIELTCTVHGKHQGTLLVTAKREE